VRSEQLARSSRLVPRRPESTIFCQTFSFAMSTFDSALLSIPHHSKNGSFLRAYFCATSSFNVIPSPGFSGK
jgi:hypothetical protein